MQFSKQMHQLDKWGHQYIYHSIFFAFLDHFSDSLQSIITSYTKFCLEFAQKVALKVLLNWDWGHEGQSPQTYKKLFPRRYRDGCCKELKRVKCPSLHEVQMLYRRKSRHSYWWRQKPPINMQFAKFQTPQIVFG